MLVLYYNYIISYYIILYWITVNVNQVQSQKEIAARAESRFFLFSATIRDFLPQKATELENFATT